MDKYEYQLKLDQINKLVGRGDYATAMKIANNIDWRRVRSVNTLSMIADVYEKNGEYEESLDLLAMAYERAPLGRSIAYRLSDLCVKLGEYDQAIEYYKDFVHSAPKDPAKLLLKYKIFRGKGAAVRDQIAILEEYRMQEYEEEWALELAHLYQEAGEYEKCVNECDELILWFNDGQYVMKAMELKMQYAELTPAQRDKYELRMNGRKLVDAREEVREAQEEQEQYAQDELPQIQDPEYLMPEEQITIEDDGQMKLEMPVYQPVERQITGQMTIQEILSEWERVKNPEEDMPEQDVVQPEEEAVEEEPQQESVEVQEADEVPEESVQEEAVQEADEVVAENPADVFDQMNLFREEELPEEEDMIPEENTFDMFGELPEIIMPEDIWNEESSEEPEAVEEVEPEQEEEISMDDILPEIVMPEGFEVPEEVPEEEPAEEPEEEQEEDEDAAEDLEAKIIGSLSEESLALADANDGTIDGIVGTREFDSEEIKRSAGRTRRQGTLTEDQQRLFSYFTPVHGMSDQLWNALENEKSSVRGGTSNTGNIMIMGESGTGKTMLAVNLVKAIQKMKNQRSGRLAKISAETLNEKDVKAVIGKLAGGALIIERASELSTDTCIRLEMAMNGQTEELLIIFEDEKQALKRFMKIHPKLAQTCTTKIDIPIFSNDELVEFGKCYAYELEYSIDEMAVLALYNRIGNMQRDDYDVSVTDVKKIIDAAIEKSERGGIGKFFGSLSKKRYDEDDCIILREKDFEE